MIDVKRVCVGFLADVGDVVGAQDIEGEAAQAGKVGWLGSNATMVFAVRMRLWSSRKVTSRT